MVLFPPPFYFAFDISNLLSYIQNNFSYELARPIMGTIFLVIIYTVGRQLSELQLSEHVGQPNAMRSHTHHNLINFFCFFFAVLMITLEFAS